MICLINFIFILLGRYAPVAQDGYRSPFLATDAAVVKKEGDVLSLLTIKRKYDPFKGRLAFPGGFLEVCEEPHQGCLRELVEETNLVGKNPQLIGVYGNPMRDPRKHVVCIFYYVQVDDKSTLKAGDDAAHAEWVPFEKLSSDDSIFAFDHALLFKDLDAFIAKNGL
eukprot:TRINITY_DN652_c0_g1_i13.p1 TRINITY_DN652_c0_g1~~TRINITY_DN652_c0_g1_i13.p1  ORF type:complete len:167 (+),score=36.28 TRINITY_DN652_c0_g1_i13:985-1485(+)